jgi:hypothetical protein
MERVGSVVKYFNILCGVGCSWCGIEFEFIYIP